MTGKRTIILAIILGLTTVCLPMREEQAYSDTIPEVTPDEIMSFVQSQSFAYIRGDWTVYTRGRDSSFAALSDEFCKHVNKDTSASPICEFVDQLHSRYFRSDYYLFMLYYYYYLARPFMTFVAYDAALDSFTPLHPKFDLKSERAEADYLRGAVRLLADDLRRLPSSKTEAIEMADDIVTLVSPDRPVIFLDDISDVYDYSNAQMSRALWGLIPQDDSATKLVSAYRISHVSENEYLEGNYWDVYYPDSIFARYSSKVKPASVTRTKDSTYVVSLNTWSPDGGVLAKWTVAIRANRTLYVRMEIIKRFLGYTFDYFL